jgi:hypothetical protein
MALITELTEEGVPEGEGAAERGAGDTTAA